jgi:hypothetical protein
MTFKTATYWPDFIIKSGRYVEYCSFFFYDDPLLMSLYTFDVNFRFTYFYSALITIFSSSVDYVCYNKKLAQT